MKSANLFDCKRSAYLKFWYLKCPIWIRFVFVLVFFHNKFCKFSILSFIIILTWFCLLCHCHKQPIRHSKPLCTCRWCQRTVFKRTRFQPSTLTFEGHWGIMGYRVLRGSQQRQPCSCLIYHFDERKLSIASLKLEKKQRIQNLGFSWLVKRSILLQDL